MIYLFIYLFITLETVTEYFGTLWSEFIFYLLITLEIVTEYFGTL